MWKAEIEKMITRLNEIAVDRGDYAYFPAGSFLPGGRYGADAPMPTGIMAEELSGRIIQGLAHDANRSIRSFRGRGDVESIP